MKTEVLFNNVSAAGVHTSEVINFDNYDARYTLQIKVTGGNSNPIIYWEESIDGSTWTPNYNPDTLEEFFELPPNGAISIKDNYAMAKFYRLRYAPIGNSQGQLYAIIGYKSKP